MGVLCGGEVQGLGWELRHPLQGRFEVWVKKFECVGGHKKLDLEVELSSPIAARGVGPTPLPESNEFLIRLQNWTI